MKLEQIVNLIRLVLNKERQGQVKAGDIKIAIENAERDLYTSLINILEYKAFVSSKILPFVRSAIVSFIDGAADVSLFEVGYLSGARLSIADTFPMYDAFVSRNDAQWAGKDFSHLFGENGNFLDDKSKYIQSAVGTSRLIPLPPEFIQFEGGYAEIGSEQFPLRIVDPAKWASRKLTDFVADPERLDDPIWLNTEEDRIVAGAFVDNSADLPEDVVKLIAFDNLINGERYEGVVVEPGQLNSRGIADLYRDDTIIKKHIAVVDTDINLISGVGDLPEYFVKDTGAFYADGHEGVILDSRQFADRVASNLLAPTDEKPIARIHDGLIEVLPNTINRITLPHYNWPNPKQPVGSIMGDKVFVYPEPTEAVVLKTVKTATERMPVVKITDGAAEVKPFGTHPVTIDYLAFPTAKAPMIRFTREEAIATGGNPVDTLFVRPKEITYGEIYFLKKLTVSKYAWSVYERDYVFDEINSVDTMFGDESIPEITSRALIYLGISKQNADAASLDTLRDNSNAKTT